jgi:GTPase SAR1 family protein
MGIIIEMCTCSSQQAIIPNSKSNIENDIINQYNNNNPINNDTHNNIEQIKKKKKISNGVILNNEQSNDAETYNNISLGGHSILTPKQKRESIYSNKMGKKDKKSKKESDKKNNKLKKRKSRDVSGDNNEDNETINVSDTVLSELIISDKIKTISKEKKKSIKGRNNINIVIIGYNEVGKTSFCLRFVENKFEDFYIPSICNENFSKIVVFNEHNYKVNFNVILGGTKLEKPDTQNSPDFFILLFDITKIRSFNQINIYLKQIKKSLNFYDKEGKNPNFCLVGNKADLETERKVNNEFINNCIKKNKIKYYEISTKTGKNVNNVIQSFIQIFDKIAFS